MKLTRHNGRSGKNGTYNPRHNDRRFDVENSGHIDSERAKKNVYWDCYRGYTTAGSREDSSQPDFSFEQIEMYGIRVNRNGMACCPFHDDRNPSLKVDKRFHCFGCQADGDVIDFVARLYGLPGLEAAKKLAADFGIPYESRGRASPKPARRSVSAELRFLQAQQKCFRVLSDYLRLLEHWGTAYAPKSPEDGWNPLFVEAMQKREYVGYLLDTLLTGTVEEKAAVITGHGKEVERIERKVSEFAARGQTSRGDSRRQLGR